MKFLSPEERNIKSLDVTENVLGSLRTHKLTIVVKSPWTNRTEFNMLFVRTKFLGSSWLSC